MLLLREGTGVLCIEPWKNQNQNPVEYRGRLFVTGCSMSDERKQEIKTKLRAMVDELLDSEKIGSQHVRFGVGSLLEAGALKEFLQSYLDSVINEAPFDKVVHCLSFGQNAVYISFIKK
jgi:hypothetical protein